MTRDTVHHVTFGCAPAHCYTHDVDEAGHGHRRCFECGHLYRTPGDLQRAWTAGAPPDLQGTPAPLAPDISFCPLCMHDF